MASRKNPRRASGKSSVRFSGRHLLISVLLGIAAALIASIVFPPPAGLGFAPLGGGQQLHLTEQCSDTDGGAVNTLKGTVEHSLEGATSFYSDYCIDESNLREYYCEGAKARSSLVVCFEKNMQCYNGACTV